MHIVNQLDKIKRLMALAETGIVYAANDFELERCQEQRQICLELIGEMAGKSLATLEAFYMPPVQYPTPKVDVRAFVLNDKDQVLLVRESMDGKWSIPGGWSDIGFSPKEVVEKEVFEEAGLSVKAKRLLAVWDKKCHPHPPAAYHIYKMVFFCEADDYSLLNKGFDILDVAFFDLDRLPELSENRILESQLKALWKSVKDKRIDTIFD